MNAHDAREFLAAGATVVQVGTAHFANPWICQEIADELARPTV
jgi:dihydroorotate dehydrogenase